MPAVYGLGAHNMDTFKLSVPTSTVLRQRLVSDNAYLRETIAKHPALLSIELGTEFFTQGIFTYDGVPSCEAARLQGKQTRRHAMVIVGMRSEGPKSFYLCMNFWSTRFFVELSDEYLARCHAEITVLHEKAPLIERLMFRDVPVFRGRSVETAMYTDSGDEDDLEEYGDDDEEGCY